METLKRRQLQTVTDGNSLSLSLLTSCSRDNTLKYNYGEKSQHFFSVSAFRFKEGYDDVFIHCKLTVCRDGDTDSRCARGCEGARRRRSLKEDDLSANLYIGPLKLTNKDAGKLGDKLCVWRRSRAQTSAEP